MAKSKPSDWVNIVANAPPLELAFTIRRISDGWSFVTISFQGDEIVAIEESQPDMKAITIEKFKIAAAKYWGTRG